MGIVTDALQGTRQPEIFGFLNRADTHTSIQESEETEEALASIPGLTVLPARLSQRTAFRRSFSEGLAVFELEPAGKAALEFVRFARILYPHLTPKEATNTRKKK
jgi:chromosome partitioning protein